DAAVDHPVAAERGCILIGLAHLQITGPGFVNRPGTDEAGAGEVRIDLSTTTVAAIDGDVERAGAVEAENMRRITGESSGVRVTQHAAVEDDRRGRCTQLR